MIISPATPSMGMRMSPSAYAPSPAPTYIRQLDGGNTLPFRAPSGSEFQVERPQRHSRRSMAPQEPVAQFGQDDGVFREDISALLAAKSRPFSVSGRIPIDPVQMQLFFRSASGITHSLDFPIDVDYDSPPALDVLIAACRPHQTSDLDDYTDYESLFYPPNLPLTTSLEIANHPILEALRTTLFPSLSAGQYLTAVRDKLEVIVSQGRMGLQPCSLRNDGRVATIAVTLPVRFRGGALIVRSADGTEERYHGRGGKSGDLEWVAFLSDCEYQVETVTKGCRVSLTYGVYLKTFGPSGPDPLIHPSDKFLDLLAPVLNASRGRQIGVYLMNDYDVNPAQALAESLVPNLKGGDSLLYHALKLYKLTPELHWAAGSVIWPIDRSVEIAEEDSAMKSRNRQTFNPNRTPALRGAFSVYGGEDDTDSLRMRIEESGALPIAESDIMILSEWDSVPPVIGRQRVPVVSNGELQMLVVNVLMVAFVP
ncbi:hypothetical protein EV714DRAFT_236545 [Schizophyllum commune]